MRHVELRRDVLCPLLPWQSDVSCQLSTELMNKRAVNHVGPSDCFWVSQRRHMVDKWGPWSALVQDPDWIFDGQSVLNLVKEPGDINETQRGWWRRRYRSSPRTWTNTKPHPPTIESIQPTINPSIHPSIRLNNASMLDSQSWTVPPGWSQWCRSPWSWAPPPAQPPGSSPPACPRWHRWWTPPHSRSFLWLSGAPPGRLHLTTLVPVNTAIFFTCLNFTQSLFFIPKRSSKVK